MSWWGKLLGGTFGFMLGGPLGALLGAALGHNFDRGLHGSSEMGGFQRGNQQRVQTAFFTACFSVMGAICKADGQVSKDEIDIARQVMGQMQLSDAQKRAAVALFNAGKQRAFPLQAVLLQLKKEIGFQPNLQRMFLEIQLYAAYADGIMHPQELQLLYRVCDILRIPRHDFDQLNAAIRTQFKYQQSGRAGKAAGISLKDAYAVLNITDDATDTEVKRAYRRLLSRHHPDKLVSRGLPEEMMKIATDRTREIRQAYEKIREKRKF